MNFLELQDKSLIADPSESNPLIANTLKNEIQNENESKSKFEDPKNYLVCSDVKKEGFRKYFFKIFFI